VSVEPQKLGGPEAEQLREQLQKGDPSGLHAFVARTRAERDWQDRLFMLGLLMPELQPAILDFACEVEPEAANLLLLCCVHDCELGMKMRGTGTCDGVGEGGFRDAAQCIKAALEVLNQTLDLDPDDPTAHA